MKLAALILVALPLVVAAYAYGLYPLILRLLARDRAAPARGPQEQLPLVTVVIPAYNEEAQIRGAIESQLAQTYPADRRQILVVSDASSDGTDAIVRSFAGQGVELLRMPARIGKTAAENAAVPAVRGTIVINSDAGVRMHPRTVQALVAAMADPAVGVSSTRDVSMGSRDADENRAEAGYVGYEMRIRALETRAGGIVGASGSGYAIRAHLHRHPVLPELSRDFSAALIAQRHGLRAVSVDDAICYVPRTTSLRREYRRKVRTISRGMDTLYFNRDLLDFTRHGLFSLKLASHKVARWLVPLSTIPALVGLVLLTIAVPLAGVLLAAAAIGLLFAILGASWPDERPLPRWLPPSVLGALAANLAVMHAAWRFFVGHEDHVWEPTRRPTTATAP